MPLDFLPPSIIFGESEVELVPSKKRKSIDSEETQIESPTTRQMASPTSPLQGGCQNIQTPGQHPASPFAIEFTLMLAAALASIPNATKLCQTMITGTGLMDSGLQVELNSATGLDITRLAGIFTKKSLGDAIDHVAFTPLNNSRADFISFPIKVIGVITDLSIGVGKLEGHKTSDTLRLPGHGKYPKIFHGMIGLVVDRIPGDEYDAIFSGGWAEEQGLLRVSFLKHMRWVLRRKFPQSLRPLPVFDYAAFQRCDIRVYHFRISKPHVARNMEQQVAASAQARYISNHDINQHAVSTTKEAAKEAKEEAENAKRASYSAHTALNRQMAQQYADAAQEAADTAALAAAGATLVANDANSLGFPLALNYAVRAREWADVAQAHANRAAAV